MYRLVARLGLLVAGTRTVSSTGDLNQIRHVFAVVQFHPCSGASGQVGHIVAGIFCSICTAGDFEISEESEEERELRQEIQE